MIKFAICDDEPMMAQELAGHLADYMKENRITAYSVSSFPNGRALLESGVDGIYSDTLTPDSLERKKVRGDTSVRF